ncbi:MAG: PIG-L deacetylase family protein [Chloroflexota bacterium]|nr:PIG-L deacetylase family protein [Chloroflexota bacterium]
MQLDPYPIPARILIIAAHPDDIEFGAAGSVAVWTAAGAEVHYCIVTNGAAGSNAIDYDHDTLVQQRIVEQNEAAALLGVQHVHYLGYADGMLQPTLELRRDLTRLIRQVKPNRVLIMDPTTRMIGEGEFFYINHPDHVATGEASLYAVFPSAETRPIFPELLAEGHEPHHVDELYLMIAANADVAVDITPHVALKKQALLCHRSQLSEGDLGFIGQFDGMAGAQDGVAFAETYRVMRFMRG